ncbi:hypothetical protein DTO207G8_5321 [Paecilomyces variotii]|nr:hypothetical protein DTO169C6_7649 [Paecilomyces variotii]KAJ9251641.1 hypothetical protein DTO207G8_5321 [Paecilomyces variotii]KAJ9383846.1 hypothetical protein DTO063F5_4950 [Paecilomyces variotii]
MDFWSRLIGGSRSLSSKTLRTNTPAERLAAFKRTCNTLQQIWRTSNSPSSELGATAHARNCLDRLNTVLSDESRGPAPHPCLAYASTSQIYVTVTKLALSSYDEDTLRSAAIFFNTLIDAEVDGIVDSRLFARALLDLVRRGVAAGEEIEGRLIELLFGVANNIRLQPHILSAWFVPKQRSDSDDGDQTHSGKEFAGETRKDDFPLFYLLIEYVHHEGRAGDFARTGLLYIIETASNSRPLERWLIESDLATLMATGLGALYSQLGRTLSFSVTDEDVPPIIAFSDHARQETAVQPQLGAHMDSFLSYLLFWQDTVDHCKSAEVNDTLLDHFQILFLQQLLYPSLLESSDVDGGSTPAVLTYLYRILESIDQPYLIHRILHYLLASSSEPEPITETTRMPPQPVRMSLSRRKSLDILAAFAEEAAKPSPSLFNLVDLVLMSIKSHNRQTVIATLRLLAVILQRHHSFAGSLIQTSPPSYQETQRTVGALNAELQQFLSMATTMVDDPTLDESYENYLKDATFILESRLFLLTPSVGNFPDGPADRPLDVQDDDPILKEILRLLDSFFTNSVVVNLALTEVITSLASSNLVSLDGWLLVKPSNYEYGPEAASDSSVQSPEPGMEPQSQPNETDPFSMIKFAYKEPTWSEKNVPLVTGRLQSLVKHVEDWRRDIPDFDVLVAARRDLLHQDEKPQPMPIRSQQPSEPPIGTPNGRPLQRVARFEAESASPRGRNPRPFDLSEASPSRFAAGGTPPRSSVGSPLREQSFRTPPSRGVSASRSVVAEDLRRRLAMPFQVDKPIPGSEPQPVKPEAASIDGEAPADEQSKAQDAGETVTLGHVLTNTVILYEFILELAALVQVRGSLFQEAGYTR